MVPKCPSIIACNIISKDPGAHTELTHQTNAKVFDEGIGRMQALI
jgi:hypothetical protein